MQRRHACIILIALVGLAACASPLRSPEIATFFVVRHAEKSTDDRKDPSLSAAGAARAEALAKRFATRPLTAAYATSFRRTQSTAAPAAQASGLAVTTYAADVPPAEFAAELVRTHPRGRVLVVGHSNTVPDIVGSLCQCKVAPIPDSQYGQLFEVHVDQGGHATMVEMAY